jgi:hypothetical protein
MESAAMPLVNRIEEGRTNNVITCPGATFKGGGTR